MRHGKSPSKRRTGRKHFIKPDKLTAYEVWVRVKKEKLSPEQYKELLIANGIIIANPVYGECSKHPGQSMINCTQCSIENINIK